MSRLFSNFACKRDMIQLDNLTIGYQSRRRKVVVAENLCACTEDGSLVCLAGVNGVGKSTLLRTIGGFQPPLGGSVQAGSGNRKASVESMTQTERSRMIGVVLTERTDLARLSVYDIVSFGRTPYSGLLGNLSEEDCTAVDYAIRLTGIESLKDRDAGTLSDGERQKVMIAKALAQQTPVIILDEPSAFLDYPSKNDLMRLLHRLAHEEGKTILLSSHDLDIVSRTADCFWVMERQEGKSVIHSEKTLRF